MHASVLRCEDGSTNAQTLRHIYAETKMQAKTSNPFPDLNDGYLPPSVHENGHAHVWRHYGPSASVPSVVSIAAIGVVVR